MDSGCGPKSPHAESGFFPLSSPPSDPQNKANGNNYNVPKTLGCFFFLLNDCVLARKKYARWKSRKFKILILVNYVNRFTLKMLVYYFF